STISRLKWRCRFFYDPYLLTVPDLERGEIEERWFSVGVALNGANTRKAYEEPDSNAMPEIDFSKGARGIHHIPPGARVLMTVSIERGVWEYFSGKAEQRGVDLSELVSEVLKRDIEINEALK